MSAPSPWRETPAEDVRRAAAPGEGRGSRDLPGRGGRAPAQRRCRPRRRAGEQRVVPGAHPRSRARVQEPPRAGHRGGGPGPLDTRDPVLCRAVCGRCSRPRPWAHWAIRTSCRSPVASTPGRAVGLEWVTPSGLSEQQRQRYSRHLLIPEVGAAGQSKLLASRVLLVGAGGLGSPAALYLAAAGVGTLGIIDFDVVELSNLQRQVLHTTDRVGDPEGRVGPKVDHRAQPRRARGSARGDARRGQRRARHRRLRRHPRRHRHVRDPVPPQRCRRRGPDPGGPRLGVPVRGPADDVRSGHGPLLSLPLPVTAATGARPRLLGCGRAGRGAGDHGPAPGQRGPQAAAGHRRDAGRPPRPVRRPRDGVHGAPPAPGPCVSGLLRRRAGRAGGRRTRSRFRPRPPPVASSRSVRRAEDPGIRLRAGRATP